MMKKSLMIVFVIILALTIVACDDIKDDLTGNGAKGLPAPTELRIEDGYIIWNPVEFAVKYTICVDGKEYFCDENKYPLSNIKDGEHIVKSKANGDGVLYTTSPYSEEFKINVIDGAIANTGYYSQFDELTMQESFLGYGFDVINSSVLYDKVVKTSSPIFNTDELMNLRLLKVDSKSNYVVEVQSEEIDSFMEEWNSSLNVKVSWGKKKIGGSVSVNTAFSGGSSSAKSKYFHCITFNNQKFYIVMQGTTDEYRSMLSSGFEKDLYSDMSPAELFNKYGTHFITSAIMGGKINSYYLYTSEKETSFYDISASVSTSVRAWAAKTDVSVSGGYKTEAESQSIYIKNTLEILGGGDFGFKSDEDISKYYADWEKSLEDHPSLIGIKDSGSLWPIWDLIDPSKDTRNDYTWIDETGEERTGSRAEQLQGYFMKYGVDNYNILAANAGIPEIIQPESITNILVNGKEPVNGVYEVFAGANNRITFGVIPETAVGYSKNIRLSVPSDYAAISDDNSEIIIESFAPANEVISVVVSAGDIKETIKLKVIKTYNVDFITSFDDVTVENPYKYQGLNYGYHIIQPPTLLNMPIEYNLVGWYKDPYFIEEFLFGTDPIVDNITLYAKWEIKSSAVYFVTNIATYEIDPIKVGFGEKIQLNLEPSLDGYIFNGFYSDKQLTQPFDFNTAIYQDTSIYLKWSFEVYSIYFKVDGITVYTDTYSINDRIISLPDVPAKSGYYGAWESFELTTGDITVNAIYEEKETFTVVFKNNDSVIKTETYNIDTEITIPTLIDENYPKYNHFITWYENDKPFVNDTATNPRDLVLTAHWDLCTVYTEMASTPNIVDNRVIIDWRNEVLTDFAAATGSSVITVNNTSSELILIGNPDVVYSNLAINFAGFEENQEFTLHLIDFNFITNQSDAIKPVGTDNGMILNVEIIGKCSIGTTYAGGNNITGFTNTVNLTGGGEMIITAGTGAYAQDGGTGISAENVTVKMDFNGSLIVTGGNGGNGYNGTCGPNDGTNGTDGWRGYNGGVAIKTTNLLIHCGNIKLYGGTGGTAGNGGCCNPNGIWGSDEVGGNGGKGGVGGLGTSASIITIESGTVIVKGGDGGTGGRPGGVYENQSNGKAGTAGSGGTAGIAINSDCVVTDNTNSATFENGIAGSYGSSDTTCNHNSWW